MFYAFLYETGNRKAVNALTIKHLLCRWYCVV